MRIFISWSGETGRGVAGTLREWLPTVLRLGQRPWISPEIAPGKVGAEQLMKALRESDAGITVVTPESQVSPWVLFESGAFAVRDRFFPYLLGLHGFEIRQPFPHFQYREATRDGTFRLVHDLGELVDGSNVEGTDVRQVPFDQAWSELAPRLEAFARLARQATRELLYGPAAGLINQAERDAVEQRHRAERHEFRARAFRSLAGHLVRYERVIDQDPTRWIDNLRRDIAFVRETCESEDFGRIAEGTGFGVAEGNS